MKRVIKSYTAAQMADIFREKLESIGGSDELEDDYEPEYRYEIQDSWGAPQAGVEITKFETYDDMIDYIDMTDGLYERIEEGYAIVKEI